MQQHLVNPLNGDNKIVLTMQRPFTGQRATRFRVNIVRFVDKLNFLILAESTVKKDV